MKNVVIPGLFILSLMTISCFPDDSETKAAKKIIDSLGARDGAVEIENGFDSENGSLKVLTFSLNGIPDSIKKIGVDNLMFWVAKTFISELPDKSIKDIDRFKIIIDYQDTIYTKENLLSR